MKSFSTKLPLLNKGRNKYEQIHSPPKGCWAYLERLCIPKRKSTPKKWTLSFFFQGGQEIPRSRIPHSLMVMMGRLSDLVKCFWF